MDTSSQIPNNNIQAQVLLMAFQSLNSKGQEAFLECLREEIEDAALLRVLEERSKNAQILLEEEENNLRNNLKAV